MSCTDRNCGPDCGQHGDMIAGFTTVEHRGATETTIHLTPRAKEGLTVRRSVAELPIAIVVKR